MTLEGFNSLYPEIWKKYLEQESKRKAKTVVNGTERIREIGGGNKYLNELPDRVIMLLMYYRLYLTQEFMTLLFKAENKSVISRSIKSVKAIIEKVLPTPDKTRQATVMLANKEITRRKKIGTIEEFITAYPELAILIDGKEQPKQRPKDKQKRKKEYSGKKKRHTIKQLISTTRCGLIIYQSPKFPGSIHDFEYFKYDKDNILRDFDGLNIKTYVDSGFQGINNLELPKNIEIRQIHKGFRNNPLTNNQKAINKLRGSIRVKIEHAIGREKKYKIASDIYRNPDKDYDSIMNIVAGLVNLRFIDNINQTTGGNFLWN